MFSPLGQRLEYVIEWEGFKVCPNQAQEFENCAVQIQQAASVFRNIANFDGTAMLCRSAYTRASTWHWHMASIAAWQSHPTACLKLGLAEGSS